MSSNAKVMATLGGLRSESQTYEYLAQNLKHWDENSFGLWMFYSKQTKQWIGRAGLRWADVANYQEVELAYALMPEFWQQGFASEMAQACIEIAFEVLHLKNIVCFTLTTNKASQRVMEKSRFQYKKNIIHAALPHVLYHLRNTRKVELTHYDSRWPQYFEKESVCLKNALGNEIKAIHHIGSTAIINMPAKPIIDMLLECDDLSNIETIKVQLQNLAYPYVRRHIIPHHSYFTNRSDNHIGFNLHIRERGDPQIKRHVHFRDYLRHHTEDAKAYAQLKITLAQQYPDNIYKYVFGKDQLVQNIDVKAKMWKGQKTNLLPANTGHPAKYWSQEKVIKAMEANLNVQMTHFAQYLNPVELIRVPGYIIVNSGLPDDTFNIVLEADFTQATAKQKITEVTDYFEKKQLPFSWWVSPYDKPNNLGEYLKRKGYNNTENSSAMYFNLDDWDDYVNIPKELNIIPATNEKTLHDFAMILTNDATSYQQYFSWISKILSEDDPVEYYVGYIDDEPVVRGLSCYFAGVVGLYWLSTKPEARKKGYGTAMQQYRLKRAKDLGYHIAVLQASEAGYTLYKRLGYETCKLFKEYKKSNGT